MSLQLQDYNYEFFPAVGYFDEYSNRQGYDPFEDILREAEKDQTTRNLALIAGGSLLVVGVVIALILKKKK